MLSGSVESDSLQPLKGARLTQSLEPSTLQAVFSQQRMITETEADSFSTSKIVF